MTEPLEWQSPTIPPSAGTPLTNNSGQFGAPRKPNPYATAVTASDTARPHAQLRHATHAPFVMASKHHPNPRPKMVAPSASDSTPAPALIPADASSHMCASNAMATTLSRPPHVGALDQHLPTTPIDVSLLEAELSAHPDKMWCSQLLHNLTHGATIGYQGPRYTRITPNLASASLHPDIITAELERECSKGHVAGPFPTPPLSNLQCSGVGVVPKKNGSWRMIMHLSAPTSTSINDYINKEDYSLRYSTIDEATKLIAAAGKGCFLAKIDLKSAFRLIPIAKTDWELLGIHWQNKYYFDKRLPFGLRSAPFLFNQLADALHWILATRYNIKYLLHYLDDFLIVAPSNAACQHDKDSMISLMGRLGIPLSWEKIEGPSTRLSFLGIEIDTINWQLRLPQEKYDALSHDLTTWLSRRSTSKRKLLSLIGTMNFATKVLPAGRIFLRRLINLSTHATSLHHHLYLNQEAKADIQWWLNLLPLWNGTAPILEPKWTPSHILHIYTDASSLHGYGAFFNGAWFRGSWAPHQQLGNDISIAWQELYAIVLAAQAWGHLWTTRRILAHCDNLAVVDIWSRYSSKSQSIMSLIRTLYFTAATYHFHIRFSHIQGVDNSIADALSRNQLEKFRKLAPMADREMTPIPPLSGPTWDKKLNAGQVPALHHQPNSSMHPHANITATSAPASDSILSPPTTDYSLASQHS